MASLNQTVQAQSNALKLLSREVEELKTLLKSELGISGSRLLTPFEMLIDKIRQTSDSYIQLARNKAGLAKLCLTCKITEEQMKVIVEGLQVLSRDFSLFFPA